MKIVVAMDSFKGSLSSMQAGHAVKEAALRVDPQSQVLVLPLADGGEGTMEALAASPDSQRITCIVSGPLMTPVTAQYCILPAANTAVIEIASAAGLTLIPAAARDPLLTTTYGVGQLIRDAIDRGCRRFIVGIGGSATNDGGTGMLTALGYAFLDRSGHPVPPGALGLKDLHRIDASGVLPQLKECDFQIACDVTNPLCGRNGCSAVFAPQKGAAPEMIPRMDAWLENYARLAGALSSRADPALPGAGAAGGLGFAFLAFTNAALRPGISMILEQTGLEEAIRQADLVITGEGRLDGQTVMGKAPAGVAAMAKKYGKRVVAFSGCVTPDAEACNGHGIDAFFPILRSITTLEEAMDPGNARKNLSATAYQVFRLLL